jgi:hypothetical protein
LGEHAQSTSRQSILQIPMTTLATIIFLFSVISANLLIYLCHRNQAYLEKPLPVLPWLVCAGLVHLHAFFAAYTYLSPLAACFIYLIVCMLSLSLIPFISLVVKRESYVTRSR